jgi:hypothetical protein
MRNTYFEYTVIKLNAGKTNTEDYAVIVAVFFI